MSGKGSKISVRQSLSLSLAGVLLAFGCGKGDDDEGHHGGGGGHNQKQAVTVDLQGSVGLVVIETDGGNSLTYGLNDGTADFQSSLYRVRGDGEIVSALNVTQGECCGHQLPRVQTVAISPHKDVYLHFEHPFIHKEVPDGIDPWQTDGYMCQVFKVAGGTLDQLLTATPTADNLECIDDKRFVDSWQANRTSVFQFDDDSNVYYPGSLRNGGGKMVVYKRARDGSSTDEVINANICVNDFLVTGNGGVFYSGESSCESGNGDGGFFRYVAPDDGGVREIARDWWDFVFEPVEGETADKAVFFGPDPRSATTASWDSACVFNFDPAGDTAEDSISEVITCGSDIWRWIDMTRDEDEDTYGRGFHDGEHNPSTAWRNEYERRCESSGQVFAGGGSQIRSIEQDAQGRVYLIGDIRKKKQGQVKCDMRIRGGHCVLAGIPYISEYTNSTCSDAGGVWTDDSGYCTDSSNGNSGNEDDNKTRATCIADSGRWHHDVKEYWRVASDACNSDSSNKVDDIWQEDIYDTVSGTYTAAKFESGWWSCDPVEDSNSGGDQWTDEYKALALVDGDTKTLSMLSGTDEQAVRLWVVDGIAYFSTYNTTLGQYFLKRYDPETSEVTDLASNFEAYNLSSGNEDGVLFYDGLDFSNNDYSFGTISTTAPYDRTQKSGLTGTVSTIVIYAD